MCAAQGTLATHARLPRPVHAACLPVCLSPSSHTLTPSLPRALGRLHPQTRSHCHSICQPASLPLRRADTSDMPTSRGRLCFDPVVGPGLGSRGLHCLLAGQAPPLGSFPVWSRFASWPASPSALLVAPAASARCLPLATRTTQHHHHYRPRPPTRPHHLSHTLARSPQPAPTHLNAERRRRRS